MRRRQKFNLIWTVLFVLAVVVWLRRYLSAAGYETFEAFFADAIVFSIRAGLVLVPLSVLYGIRARRRRVERPAKFGRTTRCHKCKRPLQEFTGSNCQFCGWIRCPCGACGCGGGPPR